MDNFIKNDLLDCIHNVIGRNIFMNVYGLNLTKVMDLITDMMNDEALGINIDDLKKNMKIE